MSTTDDSEHSLTSAAVRLAGDGQPPVGTNHMADVLRPAAEGTRTIYRVTRNYSLGGLRSKLRRGAGSGSTARVSGSRAPSGVKGPSLGQGARRRSLLKLIHIWFLDV